MAYNTKPIATDKDGQPVPQYYNKALDKYEPLDGAGGGNKVIAYKSDGTESSVSLLPILDKLSQLTGTVIDENTRKANEVNRVATEKVRVTNEDTRKVNETSRVDAEKVRVTSETERVTQELDRVTKEKVRVTSETDRTTAEKTRKTNETIRVGNENIRSTNELVRIALYDDLQAKLASGYFDGAKGETGNGLEYIWQGTKLGVRVKGDVEYVYVDLQGPQGPPGNIDNLTKQHVVGALGYTPADEEAVTAFGDTILEALDGKVDNSRVLKDVPADADFTNTVTTINGKTGAISKQDIVDIGIPAQDTNTTYAEITTAEIDKGTEATLRTITGRRVRYILDKVATLISAITKTDVGLGNVDNVKQMPIAGGNFTGSVGFAKNDLYLANLRDYTETITPLPASGNPTRLVSGNGVYIHKPTTNTSYELGTPALEIGRSYSITLVITQDTSVRTLSFPSKVKWQWGIIPNLLTANKTYVLTFVTVNGGTTWLGMSGGEF